MLAMTLAIDPIWPAAYSDCCNTTGGDRRSNPTSTEVHHTPYTVLLLGLDGVIMIGPVDAEH